MNERLVCKKCGEVWENIEHPESVLNPMGKYCWLCHHFENFTETVGDCVERVIRDFRNLSWTDYIAWVVGGNNLRALPEPQKRQLSALITARDSRTSSQVGKGGNNAGN